MNLAASTTSWFAEGTVAVLILSITLPGLLIMSYPLKFLFFRQMSIISAIRHPTLCIFMSMLDRLVSFMSQIILLLPIPRMAALPGTSIFSTLQYSIRLLPNISVPARIRTGLGIFLSHAFNTISSLRKSASGSKMK